MVYQYPGGPEFRNDGSQDQGPFSGRIIWFDQRRRSVNTTPTTGNVSEVSDTGGIGNKPPGVLNTETGAGDEFSRLQQLVRVSSDKVISLLSKDVHNVRFALSYIAQALVDTEGVEATHEYISTHVQRLNLHPNDEFGVWVDLFKKGDLAALPNARRAAGLAAEAVEYTNRKAAFGGLQSAERYVELVEAGDTMIVRIARGYTKNVHAKHPIQKTTVALLRADLFGRLYRTGDQESLNLAIEEVEAFKKAKRHNKIFSESIIQEQTDYEIRKLRDPIADKEIRNALNILNYSPLSEMDTPLSESDRVLSDMVSYAIQHGQVDDALKLMETIENNAAVVGLHVKLYGNGRKESLQPVLDYLETAIETSSIQSVQRNLAEAGYPPAQETIRTRMEDYLASNDNKNAAELIYDPDDRIKDLVTLHKTGDKAAAQIVLNIIRSCEHPEYYLQYLQRFGLIDEQRDLATQMYESDPSNGIKEMQFLSAQLITAKVDTEFWQSFFNHEIDNYNVMQAAAHIVNLGKQAKTLK